MASRPTSIIRGPAKTTSPSMALRFQSTTRASAKVLPLSTASQSMLMAPYISIFTPTQHPGLRMPLPHSIPLPHSFANAVSQHSACLSSKRRRTQQSQHSVLPPLHFVPTTRNRHSKTQTQRFGPSRPPFQRQSPPNRSSPIHSPVTHHFQRQPPDLYSPLDTFQSQHLGPSSVCS